MLSFAYFIEQESQDFSLFSWCTLGAENSEEESICLK